MCKVQRAVEILPEYLGRGVRERRVGHVLPQIGIAGDANDFRFGDLHFVAQFPERFDFAHLLRLVAPPRAQAKRRRIGEIDIGKLDGRFLRRHLAELARQHPARALPMQELGDRVERSLGRPFIVARKHERVAFGEDDVAFLVALIGQSAGNFQPADRRGAFAGSDEHHCALHLLRIRRDRQFCAAYFFDVRLQLDRRELDLSIGRPRPAARGLEWFRRQSRFANDDGGLRLAFLDERDRVGSGESEDGGEQEVLEDSEPGLPFR